MIVDFPHRVYMKTILYFVYLDMPHITKNKKRKTSMNDIFMYLISFCLFGACLNQAIARIIWLTLFIWAIANKQHKQNKRTNDLLPYSAYFV